MARVPRWMLPAYGIFHITVRGVDRCPIFRTRDDYRFVLALLRRLVRAEGLEVHAYCLMPNHTHAVVEGSMEAISRVYHRLNGIHAQRFNELHGRVGHLFGDRFHAKVVESDEHLTNACEYVWDNPVRAGLCKTRNAWPWSGRVALPPETAGHAALPAASVPDTAGDSPLSGLGQPWPKGARGLHAGELVSLPGEAAVVERPTTGFGLPTSTFWSR